MCPSNSVSALDKCVCTDENNVWNSSSNKCQLHCESPLYYNSSSNACEKCPSGKRYDGKSSKCVNDSAKTVIIIVVPVLVFVAFITTLIICMLRKSSQPSASFQMTHVNTQNLALSANTGNYV